MVDYCFYNSCYFFVCLRTTGHDFIIDGDNPSDTAALPGIHDEDSTAGLEHPKNVWEGGEMQNYFDTDDKIQLRCLHGDYHTKALGHVLGGNVNVKKCRFKE